MTEPQEFHSQDRLHIFDVHHENCWCIRPPPKKPPHPLPPSVCNFAIVISMCRAAEHPAPRPEFQDLQQQQAGHGGETLLEQEAIAQQVEKLVHALAAGLLQLLPDAVELQHQTVHLSE